MNICVNACYRLKQGLGYSKRVCTWEQLTSKWSIKQIKEFIKTKAIVINYCGKCEYCLSIKKQNYKKRVQSQLKKSKYNYLITLTFDNDQIDTLLVQSTKDKLLDKNISISPLSNLSKTTISDIVRTWKYHFKKYYGEIDFHYFLCGEYGENTQRAHYHILLMLDKPIPHLVKENVKGNHFKSKFIETSQFALYDIEPANQSINTAGYISKYLSKANQQTDKLNFNRFHMEQIDYYLKNNINPLELELLNKKEDLKYLLLINLLNPTQLLDYLPTFNFSKIKTRTCTQQRPFLKCSRGLGMYNDALDNYKAGVINGYYLNKYKIQKDILNKKNIETPELDEVLRLYANTRKNNIEDYFYKSKRTSKNKSTRTDIF